MSYLLAIAFFIAAIGGFVLEVISDYWVWIVAAWIVIPAMCIGFLKMYAKPDLGKSGSKEIQKGAVSSALSFWGETWL